MESKNALGGKGQVRLNELVEFVEIDRRQFFRIAGGVLIALSPLSMVGCGGGGGGSASGSVVPLPGQVTLPSGSNLNLTTLQIGNGMEQKPLGGSGAFTLQAHTNGPSMAVVTDPNGNGVLLGYMDPTAKTSAISVQSTAVALLSASLGGSNMPHQVKAEVVSFLNNHPDLGPLVTTLSQRIVANPTAVNDGDPAVTAALNSAMVAICGTTSDPAIRPKAASGPPPAGTPQLLIDPNGQVSGLQVAQSGANQVIATNNWRTPCRMFLYETSTTSLNGTVTNLSPAQVVVNGIDLDGKSAILSLGAVQGVNLIIADLLNGSGALPPVQTAPINVPLKSNTSKTAYSLVVLFASSNSNVPAFFSDPIYLPYTTNWQKAQQDLNVYTFFVRLTFGVFFDVFGVSFTLANFANLKTAVISMGTIADASWLAMVDSIKFGAFGSRVATCFELAVENAGSGFIQTSVQKALAPLADIAAQRAVLAAGAAKAAVSSAALKMVLGAGTLLVGLGDLSATLNDLNQSDYGDIWAITAFEPLLHLSPASPTVSPSQSPQQFTVTPPSGISGTVVWDWSVTAPVAQVTDEISQQGQSIETPSSSVFLLVTPSDIGPITLMVEGFTVVNGVKTSFGKEQTTVTVVDHVTGTLPGALSFASFAQEPNAPDTYAAAMLTFLLDPNGAVFELSIKGVPYSATVTAEQISKGGFTTLDTGAPFSEAIHAHIPGSSFYSGGGNKVIFIPLMGDLNWYSMAYFQDVAAGYVGPASDYALLEDPSAMMLQHAKPAPAPKMLPKP